MENSGFRNPRVAQGQSLIELALILPLLLMLALGVVDFARAIQLNNILVAMSREGANLASRTTETPQNIITALNTTAEPLVMATDGMVYITQIMGRRVIPTCIDAPPTYCATFPQVQAQTRAITGNATLPSQVWICPTSWLGNGNCNPLPAWVNTTAILPKTRINGVTLPMALRDGEVVFAVETLYDYTVIVNYVMETGPELYSLTVL